MRQGKRITCLMMTLVLLLLPAARLSGADLSEVQRQKEALEQELSQTKELIDGLKGSKEGIESKVRTLDAKLTEIAEKVAALEGELSRKNDKIVKTKEQLGQATKEEKAQYESMKLRIKYMYEHSSSMSLLETLLSSGSIAEFISQAEYIRQITGYDRKMLEKYEKTKATVTVAKATLESDYAQLEELKAAVQAEKENVQQLLAAKEQELLQVSGELSAAQADADVMAAEITAQEEIIAQIQAEERRKEELRRKAEEARRLEEERRAQQQETDTEQPSEGGDEEPPEVIPDDTYEGGAFVWPCPASKRVTSEYGTRLSPTAGASSNHQGIDIGAEYGSAIVAAADGTVVTAGYSSGMGNYIMLSHGSGIYTVYGHCSALLVASGDTVSAGQTIAQVGSTGISTGNHLHFGVTKDGSYVSPWNFLGK